MLPGADSVAGRPAWSMRPLHLGTVLVAVSVWGLSFSVAKIGVGQVPRILLMGMRLASVALILARFLWLPGKTLPRIVGLSTPMGVLHCSLLYPGLRGAGASRCTSTGGN